MLGERFDELLIGGIRALNKAEVAYSLIGGVAMIVSGRQRHTRDMDVIVGEQPGWKDVSTHPE